MKKLKYILSAIVLIILLVNLMTFCNTTVMAATKIPSTSISSIKVKNEAITIKWKKKSGITGYQIQYSTNSKFNKKNSKTIKIKQAKKISKKITGLKSSKKYYVRVRTYKVVKKKISYSSWSKKKCVTIKSAEPISAATTNQKYCTNNNNHSIKCGNMGRWFNSKDEVDAYWDKVDISYFEQYQNGIITFEEYHKKSPYGYECWSCSYCGKWTGNFKYN